MCVDKYSDWLKEVKYIYEECYGGDIKKVVNSESLPHYYKLGLSPVEVLEQIKLA